MKRLIQFITSILLTIGLLITASYAWFINSEFVEPNISGYSVAAYFGGGDGTTNNPFIIKNQRHLYNLAWLQYLGYFNKQATGNYAKYKAGSGTLTQYSFSIESDINMNENNVQWYLPPIGTNEYQFIGSINGNNHTISNLITTNVFSEFGNKRPNTVEVGNDNGTINNAQIIGFMGVVGAFDGNVGYKDSTEYHTASETSISSVANKVENIKLVTTTVKTNSSSTLIGIAAGYINGTISNVGVVAGGLNIGYGSSIANEYDISSYTVAGYATDGYLTKISNNKTIVINPVHKSPIRYVYENEGDITGWGGSVDMYSTFNRLFNLKNYATRRTSSQYYLKMNAYPDYKGEKYEINGAEITDKWNYYYLYNNSNYSQAYNEKIGSLNYRLSTTTANNIPTYIYLNGGHQDTFYSGYKITDGVNYIKINVNGNTPSISSTEDPDEATPFIFSNYSGSTSRIYTYINKRQYFLRNNSGNLQISTTSTTWSILTSDSRKSIGNSNYYLVYDNGWKLSNSANGCYISNGNTNNFLSTNGTNIANQSNVTNATKWYVNNNRLYTVINNQNYYLKVTNNSTLSLDTNISNAQQWTIDTSTENRITCSYQYTSGYRTYTAYLRYNSSSWSVSTSTSTLYRSYFNNTEEYSLSDTTPAMDYAGEDVTYFPLNVNGENDYTPKDINTGYIIGGTRGASTSGSIRVSVYPKTSSDTGNQNLLNYNYSTKKFQTNSVYTINQAGNIVKISDTDTSYKKFQVSKSKIEKIISEHESGIYGLHFMDQAVSKDNVLTASYALIDKVEYRNYELPISSIDFNLHSKGYINFFAGTYGSYSDNLNGDNAFFSVHQIFREGKKIVDIKEIEGIYSNSLENASYVYKYKGENLYSAPYTYDRNGNRIYQNGYSKDTLLSSLPSGYSLLFDTSVLAARNAIQNYRYNAFYFEIPMNDGEYALGSVTDKPQGLIDDPTGAYLMYLDIAANIQQVDRTEINQKSTITEYDYEFPTGIAVLTTAADTVVASSSAVITVNTAGNITMTRASANVINATGTIPTIANINSNLVSSTYIPRGVTLNGASGQMAAAAVRTTSTIYSQIQYIDHNISTGDIYETDIQMIDSNVPTYKVYKIGENNTTAGFTKTEINTSATDAEWKLYGLIDEYGAKKNRSFEFSANQDNSDGYGSQRTALYDDMMTLLNTIKNSTGTSILEYEYDFNTLNTTNTYSIIINNTQDIDNTNGSYYEFIGNTITITTTNTDGITVYITKVSGSYQNNSQTIDYVFNINGNARVQGTNFNINAS